METPDYDPAAEVVDLCRELIRMDTTNYGDQEGPGERKAAEYVAGLLDEVGISSNIYESESGRASLIARWGDSTSERDPLLLHGHLDVVPAAAEDWQVAPVQRRDPGRLRVGPRGGRHEGLRRHAVVVCACPGAGRGASRTPDGALFHRRRGSRRAQGCGVPHRRAP